MNARIARILGRGADGCFCRTCCDPRAARRVFPCRRFLSRPFRGAPGVARRRAARFVARDITRSPG